VHSKKPIDVQYLLHVDILQEKKLGFDVRQASCSSSQINRVCAVLSDFDWKLPTLCGHEGNAVVIILAIGSGRSAATLPGVLALVSALLLDSHGGLITFTLTMKYFSHLLWRQCVNISLLEWDWAWCPWYHHESFQCFCRHRQSNICT
jgi:hypothetical protein